MGEWFPVTLDPQGRPLPIGSPYPNDNATLTRRRTPPPGPTGTLGSLIGEDIGRLVRRIEDASSWESLDHYAGFLFPNQSFGIGVGYGIAANLVGSVTQLLDLIQIFILADIYEKAQHAPGWRFWEYGDYLRAQVVDRFAHRILEEKYKQRQRLLQDLKYAFQHPGEFFSALGREYVAKYHRFVEAIGKGTATGEFEAGKIAGELILDILAVIGVGEAALKFAAKIPELARLAQRLTRPIRLVRPLSAGGGAAAGSEEARAASGAARALGRTLNYRPSSGALLEATPGKTTTILGSYRTDMQSIVNELGNVKSTDLGPRTGDFNVLNVPEGYNPSTFWQDWNRPWLQNAVDRGDPFILATNPTPEVLTRVNEFGEVVPTGFGNEYNFLQSQGYTFDPLTSRMVPGR